ncbi:MAG: ATP-dependent DNA helicase RecG [Candidatus Eremiobacter antarcticus]|nr:ATP-dependent DNA helicase RecG [Candidatus Eremiobacteraeota bacterium]MBC5808980.1 ATP-dependent DNA helicase RecG [Candidatus Eremiobacteraeota bacterium]
MPGKPQDSSVLARSVRDMPGVAVRTADQLERLAIFTLKDLLRHFPYRYDDLRSAPAIASILANRDAPQAQVAGEVNAVGRVVRAAHVRLRGRIRSKTTATIDDGTGSLQAVWFGRPYLGNQLRVDARVFVRGRVDYTLTGATMNVSRHRILKDDEGYEGELIPVYPQTAGLASQELRRLIMRALRVAVGADPALVELDALPAGIRTREHFPDVRTAFYGIHSPATPEEAAQARRRLVYEEFFLLALSSALRRAQRSAEPAPDLSGVAGAAARAEFDHILKSLLPFSLTGAQERVTGEVVSDMLKRSPMNRLLQGDVGSGKTAVAIAAMLLAQRGGYQSAFMAPTEVLAAQQFNKISGLLSQAGLRCALVIGALRRGTRDDILTQLRRAELDAVIGTHALLTEDVEFHNLGLVVIDEQHRFGVLQRAALRAKARGLSPHTLVMTATPIPRTLAQTVYADLDVSIIDELPPGRRPVKTYVRTAQSKGKVCEFVRAEVEKGRQAFIVCPAIDESERALHSAVAQAQELQKTAFAGIQVALLHGRMAVMQKAEVMKLFADGFIKILISTSVIEVGVDIPNASVMLVLDAQAFGLAQLHQLRGRVGRSGQQAYCILIAPDDDEEGANRLRLVAGTNDGFAIAEEDMKIRGSGDLAGVRQHGAFGLRLAHLLHDYPVFLAAKKAADALVKSDPVLRRPEHKALAAFVAAQDRDSALRLSS